MNMFTHRQRTALGAALLLAVGACAKDTTGPTSISNPTAALASLKGVDSTFATPAFNSFLAVTGSFSGSVAVAPIGHVQDLLRATAPRLPNRNSGPALGAAFKTLAGVMAST